jgi:hypothetical protein
VSDATDPPEGARQQWDLRLLATAYVIGVAFLHQYIYWSTFSVNILEHATLFDLAKYTVWPLFGALTTGPLVLQLIHVIDEAIDKKSKVSLVIVLLAILVPLAITIYKHDPLAYLIGAGGAAAALYALLVSNDVDPFKKYFRCRSFQEVLRHALISTGSAIYRHLSPAVQRGRRGVACRIGEARQEFRAGISASRHVERTGPHA